ncbi:RagB/SusD family nutrient uptake outer membrane protein [Parabacteroides merdae]|nr:RagB/SusD family nutrient uptake outer membrane protein [Parabacteroides merdae]
MAEAYLNKGDKASAADAINVVRARAKAPLCTAADVTIDYIRMSVPVNCMAKNIVQ